MARKWIALFLVTLSAAVACSFTDEAWQHVLVGVGFLVGIVVAAYLAGDGAEDSNDDAEPES